MASDPGGSTATVNPVLNRHWSTTILDPILGTLTARVDGGILAEVTTCMGAVMDAEDRGLVICIPTRKHAATTSTPRKSSSKAICKPLPVNWMEREEAEGKPLSGSHLKAHSRMIKKATKVTSDTHGDNQGVTYDSTGSQAMRGVPHSCAYHQHSHVCTDIQKRQHRSRQTVHKHRGLHNSLQSTNTDVKQISPQRHAHCDQSAHMAQKSWRICPNSDVPHCFEAGRMSGTPLSRAEAKVSNWVRAVKPEMLCRASLDAEESWPPLLACKARGETLKSPCMNTCTNSQDRTQPLFSAKYKQKQEFLLSNLDRQSDTYIELPDIKLLNEHNWPSLQKSCKHNVLHDSHGGDKKKRTLRPLVSSNFHHPATVHVTQDQKQKTQQESTSHGHLYTTEKLNLPALLLMLNKDFIVTSPLKENLLLTLSLMGKLSDIGAPDSLQDQTTEGETKRQILVGQFKAFSSYKHFALGQDATRVRSESNAGGTSTISESLSVEYFVRRFQAKDIVPEMEVEYCSFNWKKVDFICTLYGQRVGVSVTRAMSFPNPQEFSAQMAYRLLYKKLFGLVVARHGVSKRHSFSQCILHVWCETRETARIIKMEYDGVSRELDIADDVVMVLTVADGCHARPIFYESLLRNT